MEKWIVDKIEEEYIVLEKGNSVINLKKEELGFNVKEGDILVKGKEGKLVLDKEANDNRKKYIEKLTENLWEN